jgi:hypothetical protein
MHRHVFTLAASVLVSLLACRAAVADGVVLPQSVSVTCLRDQPLFALSTSTVYTRGSTILFTNCVAYAGSTTNAAVQDLTGVTAKLILSDATTSSTNTVSAIVATNGTWTATATLPEAEACYWQLHLTDSSSNEYYYSVERLNTRAHL